jgi:hypothetical protein
MNVTEEWVNKARELIVELSLDCQRHYLEKEIYKAVLEIVEENPHPENIKNWRMTYQNIKESPPSAVKEKISTDTLPAIDFAIQGLPPTEGQALLERVQRLVEGIQ